MTLFLLLFLQVNLHNMLMTRVQKTTIINLTIDYTDLCMFRSAIERAVVVSADAKPVISVDSGSAYAVPAVKINISVIQR